MMGYLSQVCRLFSNARERVIVVSAYLGAGTLEKLLDAVPIAVPQTKVFGRWDIDDVRSGATDWRAWDVARRRGVPLFACPRLHAKMYVADDKAMVGSANATASGLGSGEHGNLELLMRVPANQSDVFGVLAMVERESVEAIPIGADVSGRTRDDEVTPFWIPEIGPERFLDALQGRKPHTDGTLKTCSWLNLSESGRDDVVIRRAVQEATSSRIVREEIDEKPTPITILGLRQLLSSKLDSPFDQLQMDHLAFLMEWLGRFGANTHMVSSPGDATPILYPGARLASYEITD